MDKKQFGSRIRKIRKENNMTVDELAVKAGISSSHMREIENGRKLPALPVFAAIADALGVIADELLNSPTKIADNIILNSLTRRMRGLSQEKFDLICYVCDTLIMRMKSEEHCAKRDM